MAFIAGASGLKRGKDASVAACATQHRLSIDRACQA
jgi:hypothetical protein